MKTVEDFVATLSPHERNLLSYMDKATGKHAIPAFILLDEQVVETNMMVAVLWTMHYPQAFRVALDTVGGYEISTVFLTAPHGTKGDEHFETMVTWSDRTRMYRSRTLKGAKSGHEAIVNRLREGGLP